MVLTVKCIFWISVAILLYTYLFYAIIITIMARLRPRKKKQPQDIELPEVAVLVAAFNEEFCIEEKILNTFALDYPADKLSFIIVTDGSTDRTPEIVARYPSIRHFHQAERKGKIHAVNRIMKNVNVPIVVFCDANTFLNRDAIKNLVQHYGDPTIGGVSGEKRIVSKSQDSASGSGEGLYWKYESYLKKMDSAVYSLVGAAGELFSIRTRLFEPPPQDSIIEDFYLSMKITAKGYRFVYEPDAIATETASVSVEEEWKRKVRICAGGFQSIARLLPLLNPFRFGILSFQYISHRVLRWTLAPAALPVLAISNLILAWSAGGLYTVVLILQAGFYLLAGFGHLLRGKKIRLKGFFVPYYFLMMNLSVYAGFVRYLSGRQSVVWERARRSE